MFLESFKHADATAMSNDDDDKSGHDITHDNMSNGASNFTHNKGPFAIPASPNLAPSPRPVYPNRYANGYTSTAASANTSANTSANASPMGKDARTHTCI